MGRVGLQSWAHDFTSSVWERTDSVITHTHNSNHYESRHFTLISCIWLGNRTFCSSHQCDLIPQLNSQNDPETNFWRGTCLLPVIVHGPTLAQWAVTTGKDDLFLLLLSASDKSRDTCLRGKNYIKLQLLPILLDRWSQLLVEMFCCQLYWGAWIFHLAASI